MQIQISWLLQKPADLDLHCLQRQGISGFSRTRVYKKFPTSKCFFPSAVEKRVDKRDIQISRFSRTRVNKKFPTSKRVFPSAVEKRVDKRDIQITIFLFFFHKNILVTGY